MNVSDAIDEWADANQATVDRIQRALARAAEKSEHITMSIESPDGSVEVVIGSDKLLREITIQEEAYETYTEEQLGRLIVAACKYAKKAVTVRHRQLIDVESGADEKDM